MATATATATAAHSLSHPLRPEGDWRHAFSYHPMDVQIERAEGVFIYDTDGNRYFDASGGPMAVNLPHNHPRIKRAIAAQLENYAYTHPSIADPRRSRPRSSWPARRRWPSATGTSTRSSATGTPTTG